jgi:hypothetical protein
MAIRLEDIPNIKSSDTAWIQYYRDLKRDFGRRNANSIWVATWEQRGGKNSSANTVMLRNEMKKHKIEVTTTGGAKLLDFADNVGDTLSTVFKMGTILVFTTIGITVIGFGMILFNIAKEPSKAIGVASGTALKTYTGGV